MYSQLFYQEDNCREIKLADYMIAIYLKLTVLIRNTPPPKKNIVITCKLNFKRRELPDKPCAILTLSLRQILNSIFKV